MPQTLGTSPYPLALGLAVQPFGSAFVKALQLSADGQNWTTTISVLANASGAALTLSDGLSAMPVYVPLVASLATPIWVQTSNQVTFVVAPRNAAGVTQVQSEIALLQFCSQTDSRCFLVRHR